MINGLGAFLALKIKTEAIPYVCRNTEYLWGDYLRCDVVPIFLISTFNFLEPYVNHQQ